MRRDHSPGVAIRLILVIFCQAVNVETESRILSDLEAQRVYRWQ